MPLVIKFEAPNMERVEAAFTQIGDIDLRELWPHIREELMSIEAELYASQGSSGMHGEWEPNEPRYQAWKERRWMISEIERASGRTFYSLTGETADSIFESGPAEMRFGTGVPYAIYQQTGFRTRLGDHRRPAVGRSGRVGRAKSKPEGKAFVEPRRLFDLTDGDVTKLERTAHRWYINKARALGFRILGRDATAGEALAAGRIALGEKFPVSEGM